VWRSGAEPVAAVAATGTIVGYAADRSGTIHLYIAGQHVACNVGGTDTADEVASASRRPSWMSTTSP
jgi:phage tail sheath gpL-like